MATNQEKSKAYERFADLSQQLGELRGSPSAAVNAEAVAADLNDPDMKFRAVRGGKSNGKIYKPGDYFPRLENRNKMLQLAKHGYITSEREYQRGLDYMKAKKTKDAANEMMAQVQRELSKRAELIGQKGYHEQEARRLGGDIEGVESVIEQKEQELENFLVKNMGGA